MKAAQIYLEAHVTIEPIFGAKLEEATKIAEKHNFRVAKLLMQTNREGTEERSSKDTFMTGHSLYQHDIKIRTKNLVKALQKQGFKVWRYKIEDTILDSRHQDIWNFLS